MAYFRLLMRARNQVFQKKPKLTRLVNLVKSKSIQMESSSQELEVLILHIVSWIFLALSFIGALFLAITILRTKEYSNSSEIVPFLLSCFDILWFALRSTDHLYYIIHGSVLPRIPCIVTGTLAFYVVSIQVNICFLLSIFVWNSVVREKEVRIKKIGFRVLLSPALWMLPYIAIGLPIGVFGNERSWCFVKTSQSIHIAIHYALVPCSITTLILLVCYAMVIFKIRKQAKVNVPDVYGNRKKRYALVNKKIALYIILNFIITSIPSFTLILKILGNDSILTDYFTLVPLNLGGIINFFIYTLSLETNRRKSIVSQPFFEFQTVSPATCSDNSTLILLDSSKRDNDN